MKIESICLPNDNIRRKYFEAGKVVYVQYPEYEKVANDGSKDYYVIITIDTWEEHLIKGIFTVQKIAQTEPIVKLYDSPHGLYAKLIEGVIK